MVSTRCGTCCVKDTLNSVKRPSLLYIIGLSVSKIKMCGTEMNSWVLDTVLSTENTLKTTLRRVQLFPTSYNFFWRWCLWRTFFGGIISTPGYESSKPDGLDLSSSSQGDSTHATFHKLQQFIGLIGSLLSDQTWEWRVLSVSPDCKKEERLKQSSTHIFNFSFSWEFIQFAISVNIKFIWRIWSKWVFYSYF